MNKLQWIPKFIKEINHVAKKSKSRKAYGKKLFFNLKFILQIVFIQKRAQCELFSNSKIKLFGGKKFALQQKVKNKRIVENEKTGFVGSGYQVF